MMFFKRIGAYLVDCIILFFVITIVNLFIPVNGNVQKLTDKTISLMNDYIEEKITAEDFTNETNDLNYEISKATYVSSISSIVIYILYFVVFQVYNNGQTFGKKWLKIKVVKEDDSKIDINTMLVRCLIPYGILVNFLSVVFILFMSKNLYINLSGILSYIQTSLIIVTLVLMLIKSKGLHDYLAHTKVKEI